MCRKKKYIVILIIALILVMLMGIFVISFSLRDKINTNIDKEYIDIIQNLYGIELPQKGTTKEYQGYGDKVKLVEVHLNQSDYKIMVEQLKKVADSEPYYEDLSQYYGIVDDDIEGCFTVDAKTKGIYYKSENRAYISGVEDGVFRVLFEMGGK